MYDKILYQDLTSFKEGLYTLENIEKIVKCRTKDRIYLVNLLSEKNLINKEQYEQLMQITQDEYKKSFWYIYGWISKYEL